MTYLHKNTTASKAELAHAASCELTYILSALGIEDDLMASSALRAALESRSSLKDAARATANTLRRIKLAIRCHVEDSKAVSRDRDTARAGRKLLAADSRELVTSRDFWKAKADGLAGHLRDVIGDRDAAREAERFWHREAESLGTSYTTTDPVEKPRAPCGCDTEREYCDLCKMPDPRKADKADSLQDRSAVAIREDTAKAESYSDRKPAGSILPDHVERSLIEDHARARRRAARQAADDAERARDRSARRDRIDTGSTPRDIAERSAKAVRELARGTRTPAPTVQGYPYCTTCGGTDRVSDGGHGQDEGSLCAHCGGAATTKTKNNDTAKEA